MRRILLCSAAAALTARFTKRAENRFWKNAGKFAAKNSGRFADGKAVITSGGNLAANFVIHTVGPIYGRNQDKDAEMLANCYVNSLALAVEYDLQTISFRQFQPARSVIRNTKPQKTASHAIKGFLAQNEGIKQVNLIFFSIADAEKFIKHQDFQNSTPK